MICKNAKKNRQNLKYNIIKNKNVIKILKKAYKHTQLSYNVRETNKQSNERLENTKKFYKLITVLG